MVSEIVRKVLEEELERLERMMEIDSRRLEENKERITALKAELGV